VSHRRPEHRADHRHRVPGDACDLLVRSPARCAISFANATFAFVYSKLDESSASRCWSVTVRS
jgi:hypothetical protein